MGLADLIGRFRGRLGAELWRDGLFRPREMRRILRREQARTDRTGDPFAVLVFTVRPSSEQRETLRQVARIVRRRIRLTDEAGWLDDERIGVVLPSTPAQGAWTVADDVCLALPSDLELPNCEVYVYPAPRVPVGPADQTTARHERPTETTVSAVEALLVDPMPLWKRTLDICGALVGLIFLSPLLLGAAVAIKLSSPGPIIFRQMRSGRGGRPFLCLKFRTMVVDAEARKKQLMAQNEQDGPAFKIRNDPRVTRIGRWLRKTSIDELPQLFNVLCGDMSLVGPRPLPCHEAEACRGWLRRRLDVTPGVTCIWQIYGRSRVTFAEWVRMDLRYIRSYSLWQDLKLIFQTVPAVLVRRNGC